MTGTNLNSLKPHKRTNTCYEPGLTQVEWHAIVQTQSFRCFYCGNFIDYKAEIDHLIPVSHDGCTCSGNTVASCKPCNSMKRDKPIEQWLAERPSFLRIAGNFSTRELLLTRSGPLFWNHLSAEMRKSMAEMPQRKDMNRALGLKPKDRRSA